MFSNDSGEFASELVLTLDDLIAMLPGLGGHTTAPNPTGKPNGHSSPPPPSSTDTLAVVLLLSGPADRLLAALQPLIAAHAALFADRICLCSESPALLYRLRRLPHANAVVSALWLPAVDAASSPLARLVRAERLPAWRRALEPRVPATLRTLWRCGWMRLLAPAVGASVVFVPRDEFSLGVRRAWLAAGVRPVVYQVNTPNEKLFYQRTRTHYLTGSLRTEPQFLLRK